ncbi:Vps55 family protein [Flavobacteriaceae bacterium]|nr:Vps55 family protein [Flavobacteriaceae bacterium]
MNTKQFYILIANALLASIGIMLILISSFQYNNWWPFITIFVHLVALFFPTLCGGCSTSDTWSYDPDEITPASISWVFLGFFVTVGYMIPIELYRVDMISETGVYLTIAGGTTVLLSILIFVRLLYFEKDSQSAYMI